MVTTSFKLFSLQSLSVICTKTLSHKKGLPILHIATRLPGITISKGFLIFQLDEVGSGRRLSTRTIVAYYTGGKVTGGHITYIHSRWSSYLVSFSRRQRNCFFQWLCTQGGPSLEGCCCETAPCCNVGTEH